METLKQAFAIDYRSLRLFRIGLGLGLILEAFCLSFAINDFFTDAGLYPRSMIFLLRRGFEVWTPLNLFAGWWWPALWLLFMASLGALLLFNKWPRLVSLLAFFLVQMFIFRSPYIFYGSDKLLQMLCFWSVFLPPGRKEGESKTVFSDGISAAVLLQVVVLYAIAGFAKSTDMWWDNPIASYLAMQGDAYVTPLGKFLTGYPTLLEWGTRVVFVLERFGWILLFVTAERGLWRLGIVSAYALMHIVFGLCLNLQLFPYFDVVLLTLALPSIFWEKLRTLPRFFQIPSYQEAKRSAAAGWSLCAEPLAMFFIALVMWVAVHTMPTRPLHLPKKVGDFLRVVGLHQAWDLFAPHPYLDDGWHMLIGHTVDGKMVDLFTNKEGAINMTEPGHVAARNPNYRWTAFLFQWRHGNPTIDNRLAQYLCHNRRDLQGRHLRKVDVYWVNDPTVPPGQISRPSSDLRSALVCQLPEGRAVAEASEL
ncbi:MAG: hypothetical protein KF799_04810 [Bdellovibrionales bacterium]|nr:hypothetical protein [Bdellovibrionales bacterium]